MSGRALENERDSARPLPLNDERSDTTEARRASLRHGVPPVPRHDGDKLLQRARATAYGATLIRKCQLPVLLLFVATLVSLYSPSSTLARPTSGPPAPGKTRERKKEKRERGAKLRVLTNARLELAAASLVRKDARAAVGYLRPLFSQPKGGYVLNQLGRYLIGTGKLPSDKKPDDLGMATACHNIFLFLRAQGLGREQARPWAEEALPYYRRAAKTRKAGQRAFAQGAGAALLAELGRNESADAWYRGFDPKACDPEDRAMLTAYVECAFGRKAEALAHLREAIRQDRKTARTWLAVSDDFYRLSGDPDFEAIRRKVGYAR